MLSVEEAKAELNAPFEEGRERPARCYSRREAEAARRLAYRVLRPLARADAGAPGDQQPDDQQSD